MTEAAFTEKNGLIVAMLIDKNGNVTQDVGINLDKVLTYDCKEKYVMELSITSLSVYCGQKMVFEWFFELFSKVGELWNIKEKRHG